MLASSLARFLNLSGLLLVAAFLLEISAELSIELGRIMQKHWEEQQLFISRSSCQDFAALDSSMKRSASLGSMKRVASGNTLHLSHLASNSQPKGLTRVSSVSSIPLPSGSPGSNANAMSTAKINGYSSSATGAHVDENTFSQRLMRGISTILSSRLLMAIFTYNALHASTSVLLSFQRAELVASRNKRVNVSADTAFLARINMASSLAVFVLQASGLGTSVAHRCGSRGSLALMPLIRLFAVLSLAWWHKSSGGKPPS